MSVRSSGDPRVDLRSTSDIKQPQVGLPWIRSAFAAVFLIEGPSSAYPGDQQIAGLRFVVCRRTLAPDPKVCDSPLAARRIPVRGSIERSGRENGVVWNAEYNGWTLSQPAKLEVDSSTEGFPEVRREMSSNRF